MIYLNDEGKEVKVTAIIMSADGKGYNFKDKEYRGIVTKWVRIGNKKDNEVVKEVEDEEKKDNEVVKEVEVVDETEKDNWYSETSNYKKAYIIYMDRYGVEVKVTDIWWAPIYKTFDRDLYKYGQYLGYIVKYVKCVSNENIEKMGWYSSAKVSLDGYMIYLNDEGKEVTVTDIKQPSGNKGYIVYVGIITKFVRWVKKGDDIKESNDLVNKKYCWYSETADIQRGHCVYLTSAGIEEKVTNVLWVNIKPKVNYELNKDEVYLVFVGKCVRFDVPYEEEKKETEVKVLGKQKRLILKEGEKYGWYSLSCDSEYGYYRCLNPDGKEVRVTYITTDPDCKFYSQTDKEYRGLIINKTAEWNSRHGHVRKAKTEEKKETEVKEKSILNERKEGFSEIRKEDNVYVYLKLTNGNIVLPSKITKSDIAECTEFKLHLKDISDKRFNYCGGTLNRIMDVYDDSRHAIRSKSVSNYSQYKLDSCKGSVVRIVVTEMLNFVKN